MKYHALATALLLSMVGVPALAAAPTDIIVFHPPSLWVLGAPDVVNVSTTADTPVRINYVDNQIHIKSDGTQETYTAYSLKILKPEALPLGNVQLIWQPSEGTAEVHYLHLIRHGQTTDVLASNKFTILQRESQLEQSMLNGQRTATLQVPGLQVGDEIAFAATISRREPALGGHVDGLMQMPVIGTPGTFRFRLLWPHSKAVVLRGSNDLPNFSLERSDGEDHLELIINNPKGSLPTDGAPPRYNFRRLIQYSDFGSWPAVSRDMAALFEHAAQLRTGSPIEAEASSIAMRTKDPVERAQAALQLVQDRIRYVFVALNGGNYVPADAEETWTRRFGDCKAKTVLLIALLRQLGIEAEPALVSSAGGDGMNERLPGVSTFDHVIVRAIVEGKVEWLDGTRLGDRYLDNLPSPFRWALPLTTEGSELEKIAPRDTGFPALTGIVEIDATAGVDRDARVSVTDIIRGDEAFALRTRLAALSAEDADRALKSYWRQQIDWVTPDKALWSYDERRMAIVLGLTGTGNPGWKGDVAEGHNLTILGAGFYPPDPLRRPVDQDQSAGWTVQFPRFRCWATTIRLPEATGKFAWSLSADPMDQKLGGFHYWRASGINNNVVRTVMSTHSYEPEASPKEAEIVNREIPNFNNNMSSVSEEAANNNATKLDPSKLPFGDNVDWLNAPSPCSSNR